jgi:hypothetical protein
VKGLMRFAVVLVAGAAVSLAGVYLGAWWLAFPAGVAMGALLPRARMGIPGGAVAGLVGWAVPLIADQAQYGLAPTMTSLAAVMGFNGAALIPLVLTLLLGTLLGLTGAWVGAAARALYRPVLRAVEKLRDERLEVVDPVLAKR